MYFIMLTFICTLLPLSHRFEHGITFVSFANYLIHRILSLRMLWPPYKREITSD